MQYYILAIQRDMQNEFTFMQRIDNTTNADIVKQVNLVGHYEQSFGKSTILACEILNYKDNMDIDDMILQHPYIKEWTLKYIANYQFNTVKS